MEYVREIPPECLCPGEAAGVWSGWSSHGDREVVREAAAKGTHVELARKCLAYRRRCPLSEARRYFAEELEAWIDEMLEKRQIHRASHILKNAGRNPLEFITDRCVKRREPKLQRYLADYASAMGGLAAEHREAWDIIESVVKLEEKNRSEASVTGDRSIEEISQLPDDVKSGLIAELAWETGDSRFWDRSTGPALWDYLLANNEIDRIFSWIEAQYGDVAEANDAIATAGEISETSMALRRLPIDEDTVERVASSGASYPVKESVLDRLSGYGILTREERQSARSVLARFISNRGRPEELSSVLAGSRSTVNPVEFEKKIFSIIYQRAVDESPEFGAGATETESLFNLMSELFSRPTVRLVKSAIVDNVGLFHEDREAHFRDDPILLLALLFAEYPSGSGREDVPDFGDSLKKDLSIGSGAIGSETIGQSLKKVPYLAAALGSDSPKSNEPTMYDLLNGCAGLDVARCFRWRDRNEEPASFRCENLARRYGREEKLSYADYLRESRPGMAVRALERESTEAKLRGKLSGDRRRRPQEADEEAAEEEEEEGEGLELEEGTEEIDTEGRPSTEAVEEAKAAGRLREELEETTGNDEAARTLGYGGEARRELGPERPRLRREVKRRSSRPEFGSDVKVEAKVEAAAYARALALELGTEEVTCACVAFIELLGLSSECLRVEATGWAYAARNLGVSIRESLRSLGPSSSPRDAASLLRLLERSFEAELTRNDTAAAAAARSLEDVSPKSPENSGRGLEEGRAPWDARSFVEASRTWETIVRFARIHETASPRLFPRILAGEDRRLEFVLAGQLFSYPVEAMLESARRFPDPRVREHISLATGNARLPVTRNDRETRKGSREIAESPGINRESEGIEEDLWGIALRCHASQDPPGAFLEASRNSRSPVLTVLAACYEPSGTPGFCYAWLLVSLGATEKLSREYEIPLREGLWSARSVRSLLRSCLDLGYADSLARAFLVFMPEHPLGWLFRVYRDFRGDPDNQERTVTGLRGFLEARANLGRSHGIDWENASNEDYLWNSRWIGLVAVECAITFVARCSRSLRLGLLFLELHARVRFNEELEAASPNLAALRRLVAILAPTPVEFSFDALLSDDRDTSLDRETQRCVDRLLELEDFENAIAFSKVAGLRCSGIILAQYRSEFERSTGDQTGNKLERSFWKRCADDLGKYEVSFEETAAFFIEHAEKVSSRRERYEILKLALESLEPIVTDKKILDTVEMAMWKSCVLAGPDSIEIDTDSGTFDKTKAELLSGVADLRVSCTLNDAAEESAVESLIGRFLAAGRLAPALRDLQILMVCLSLAEGETSPYQLTSQQRRLLSESGRTGLRKYTSLRNRGLQRGSPVPSVSGSSPRVNEDSRSLIRQIQLDALSIIDRLVKSLESGSAIGARIFLCVKLATHLRRSYRSLLRHPDPMRLLREVVATSCDRKLEMVGDVIAAYRIKNEDVAKFLAEEIVANAPRLVEESLDDSLVMWGEPLGTNIQPIIDLCNDPSLLGWELLRAANLSLGNSHGERRNVLTLKVAVELLIRSHDCFTASCSTEGIASILRKAQHLAYTLQHRKHWSLLVRLVTGLGRFTEMNYVFQILKENDQFEFLLGKGLDKICGLKTALLEFCKRQCPGDKELFTLIALHFTMYNEIAYTWESEARDIVNEIVAEARKNTTRQTSGGQAPIQLRITRNDRVEKKLRVVVENFTHSTEYYLQDNKLKLASRCSYQAQLAALQISLLSEVTHRQDAICLLNLSPEELNRAICQELTLPQALALSQAYDYRGDWSSALYTRVVLNGEARYLKEFLARRSLTAAIVQDCVSRYRSEKTLTKQMTESMETLVAELKDVECKYVLASQLGFKRIIEDMLSDPSIGSYLKDTVWKQGFKHTDFYE